MSQELVETGSNEVAVPNTLDDWGVSVSKKDIIIPKILCMQGLSDLVSEEKAKMGDLVDSMTNEVIGNCTKKPIKFVPFHLEKIWIISKKAKGQKDFEFDRIEDVTPLNENKPWTEMIGDDEFKNEYTMNFYVLRPEDTSLPYTISFKGTSSRAGKTLATQMYVRNAAAGKVPPAYTMELSGKKEKNDKGTFYVLQTKVVNETPKELVAEAFNWYKTVTAGGVKVHAEEQVNDLEVERF